MTKMMINENMREEVIDAIAEWMADNTEFSADFLRSHGEDWLNARSLEVEIVGKYSAPSWEDVNSDIVSAQCTFLIDTFETFTKSISDGEATAMTFGGTCHNVVAVHTVGNCLIKTKCYGADESMYQKICDDLVNDNLLCVIATDADEYVQSMNVPFEKAIEIVVKNEYLEGRWF